MRFPGRLFVLGQANDLLDLFRRYPGLTAATFADHRELGQPFLGEPGPPRPHRHRGNPNARGDLGVGHTIGGQQQHLGPLHLPTLRSKTAPVPSVPHLDRWTPPAGLLSCSCKQSSQTIQQIWAIHFGDTPLGARRLLRGRLQPGQTPVEVRPEKLVHRFEDAHHLLH